MRGNLGARSETPKKGVTVESLTSREKEKKPQREPLCCRRGMLTWWQPLQVGEGVLRRDLLLLRLPLPWRAPQSGMQLAWSLLPTSSSPVASSASLENSHQGFPGWANPKANHNLLASLPPFNFQLGEYRSFPKNYKLLVFEALAKLPPVLTLPSPCIIAALGLRLLLALPNCLYSTNRTFTSTCRFLQLREHLRLLVLPEKNFTLFENPHLVDLPKDVY